MFRESCRTVRESIFGVLCQTPMKKGQTNFSNGTAFMIAPGICATASHVLHMHGDISKPVHEKLEVIRAPDVGKRMLQATLIADNPDRDLALISINDPNPTPVLKLYNKKIDTGPSRLLWEKERRARPV